MGSFLSCLKSNSRKKHRPLPTEPDLVPLPKLSNEGDYDNYIKFEPYYFGNISRYEAEELLFLPETLHGAFIIRDTFNTSHKYSISVRFGDGVKHFRIQQLIDGRYFVVRRKTFSTLHELIQYYVTTALMKPYVQVKKHVNNGYVPHSFVPQWICNPLKTLRKLSPGQFGSWKNIALVALKTLKTTEMQIIKMLRHNKLIQLYAVFNMEEPIYIITELMKNGSLFDFLQGKGLSLKLQQLIYISVQKGSGIYHLEYQNYIHLTLVSRYDLIEKNSIVKIKYYCIYKGISGTITIIYDYIT